MPYGDTGYIEQGYANVAALPYEMQLMEVQNKRMALEQNQIAIRGLRRNEMDDIQNRQEADQFTGWLQNNPDATLDQQSEYVRQNPGLIDNETVVKFLDYGSKQDDILTKGLRNRVARKQADQDKRVLDNTEENWDKMEETANLSTDIALATAIKKSDDMRNSNFDDIQNNKDSIGASIYSLVSTEPNGKEMVENTLGLFEDLASSDNPLYRDASVSMKRLFDSMGAMKNLNLATTAQIRRHQPSILQYNILLGKERDVMREINNPDTRDAVILEIGKKLDEVDATDEERDKFKEFTSTLSTAAKVEADGKVLRDDLFSSISEIEELRMQPDSPENQKTINKKLAALRGRAGAQSAYVASGVDMVDNARKLQKQNDEDQKTILGLRKDVQSLDLAKQREARYALSEIRSQQISQASSDLDYKKLLRGIYADETAEQWGVSPDKSIQENIEILRNSEGISDPNDI
jgi:hypothetical protein